MQYTRIFCAAFATGAAIILLPKYALAEFQIQEASIEKGETELLKVGSVIKRDLLAAVSILHAIQVRTERAVPVMDVVPSNGIEHLPMSLPPFFQRHVQGILQGVSHAALVVRRHL